MRTASTLLLLTLLPALTPAADGVDYARDIKPLLLAKCGSCHGALQQQAGFRLDAAQLLRASGLVVEGDTEASELWHRVTTTDTDLRMPPEGEGEPLDAEQRDTVRRWIEAGAVMPKQEAVPQDPLDYWSYQPVARPTLPALRHPEWARSPIDTFVAAKLEEHGLAPRQPASREVWLRRVTLDLTGLPPTRQELHAFLADDRPDAFERVVDDLLERPAYGERWGRHWMDVWRYSDWYGSRAINEIRYSQRHIWRWRDWIVESVAQDRPYDEMVVAMLAGDEVAPLDPDVHRATGFLGRNWYKFDRDVWLFETVEQTSQAFLGLTLRCARCHDHKYDPISQRDYYRFRAFFEPHDVRTDPLRANTPTEKDSTLGQVLTDGVARVYDKQPDAPTYRFERGDARYPDESEPIDPGVPAAFRSPLTAVETVALPVEAFYPALRPELASGAIEAADAAVAAAERTRAEAKAKRDATEQRLAEWQPVAEEDQPAPFLADDFASRQAETWKPVSGNWAWQEGKLVQTQVGNFHTIESTQQHPRDFRVRVRYRTLEAGTYRSVGFSFDQNGLGDSQDVYTSISDNGSSVQAFHRQGGKQSYPKAGIVLTPLRVGEVITIDATVRGSALEIRVDGEPKLDYVMPVPRRDGKFALWVHAGAAEFLDVELSELRPSRGDFERGVVESRQALARADREVAIATAQAESLRARLAAEKAKYGGASAQQSEPLARAAATAAKQVDVEKAALALLVAEQHLANVRETAGGSADAPAVLEARKPVDEARKAHAAALAAREAAGTEYEPVGELYPPVSTGRRRALAEWIVDPRNPRTARVAVNHIWLRHFGEALVPSVANFGLDGDEPSHPELLDWLADRFVRAGWRRKPLHRAIVLSAVYRQASSPEAPPAWPERQLGVTADRANRLLWRMNGRRMEAEVVRDAVLATAGQLNRMQGGKELPENEAQTNYRRSLYFRITPNERAAFLETFDVADPNACYRRKESVVPHQSLALMNSSLALDSARRLAAEIGKATGSGEGMSDREFIVAAFERTLGRSPREAEVDVCREFLDANAELVAGGELDRFPPADGTPRAPAAEPALRARENLVLVLFNHNDFVTVR